MWLHPSHRLSIFYKKRKGILMMDVLLGLAIFSVIVGFMVFSMLYSQRGLLVGGDRMRAVFLTQRAMEAVKAIRDRDFADLSLGTYGVTLDETGVWQLTGTGTVTSDQFSTSITLADAGDNQVSAAAQTSWDFGPNRGGTVTLHTTFTDWRSEKPIANWTTISLEGAYIDDGTPLFNAITSDGSYAFVTSETSDGGAGLYIFDITDPSNPLRVNEGFTLGAAGYDILLWNENLIVVTADENAEVRIYDISDPLTLSSGNVISSINIPGSGRARALAAYGDYLFVSATEDGTESELYSYDIFDEADPSLLDELDEAATFWDITLHDGYAYAASSSDVSELRVIDVFDPSDMQVAPGGGYNLTDTPDGLSIVALGDYVLLGREYGDVTEELVLFDISVAPVPDPPPGPWYASTGENANSLVLDPTGTYAFAATNLDAGELRILDMETFAAGGYPFLDSYDTETGQGRAVAYSSVGDYVFLGTNTAFIILAPGS